MCFSPLAPSSAGHPLGSLGAQHPPLAQPSHRPPCPPPPGPACSPPSPPPTILRSQREAATGEDREGPAELEDGPDPLVPELRGLPGGARARPPPRGLRRTRGPSLPGRHQAASGLSLDAAHQRGLCARSRQLDFSVPVFCCSPTLFLIVRFIFIITTQPPVPHRKTSAGQGQGQGQGQGRTPVRRRERGHRATGTPCPRVTSSPVSCPAGSPTAPSVALRTPDRVTRPPRPGPAAGLTGPRGYCGFGVLAPRSRLTRRPNRTAAGPSPPLLWEPGLASLPCSLPVKTRLMSNPLNP